MTGSMRLYIPNNSGSAKSIIHREFVFKDAKNDFPKRVENDFGLFSIEYYKPSDIDEWFAKWFGEKE